MDDMAMPDIVVCEDTGAVSIADSERQKYQWKYAKIEAGIIKKKQEKKQEE